MHPQNAAFPLPLRRKYIVIANREAKDQRDVVAPPND
jgi:hypothetical protein